jgi:hypothetical protein
MECLISIFRFLVCRKELCSITFPVVVVVTQVFHANEGTSQPKKPRVEFTHSIITADPGNRKPNDFYESEIMNHLRRACLEWSNPTSRI